MRVPLTREFPIPSIEAMLITDGIDDACNEGIAAEVIKKRPAVSHKSCRVALLTVDIDLVGVVEVVPKR